MATVVGAGTISSEDGHDEWLRRPILEVSPRVLRVLLVGSDGERETGCCSEADRVR